MPAPARAWPVTRCGRWGAHVVAADREFDMAAYGAAAGPAVTADVTALPFRSGAFDVVVAAFVVNHLPDPVAGLAELRRVTRPGGAVLASTFSDDRAAAKGDGGRGGRGVRLRRARRGTRDFQRVRAGGRRRGLGRAGAGGGRLRRLDGHRGAGRRRAGRPADVVRYRLGMPHLHHFAATLAADARAAFVADAVEAVRRTGERFAPVVVEAVGGSA